jgi:hypothetical protein
VRGFYVPISDPATRRALVRLATREMRDPRYQAARFIVDGLRAAGALPIEVVDYHDVTDDQAAAGVEPASAVGTNA